MSDGTMSESAKRQPSGGSRKGVPNRATANAREAIARLVDNNTHRLEGWLNQIAADEKQGPMAAWRCFMDVIEYHIPKLQRTEVANADGKAFRVVGLSPDDVE